MTIRIETNELNGRTYTTTIETPDQPETHQFNGHTLNVREYRGLDQKRPRAIVDIDGIPGMLILDNHGLLHTTLRSPDNLNAEVDLYVTLRDQGLIEWVCRNNTANADDTLVWRGPIPIKLRPHVRA